MSKPREALPSATCDQEAGGKVGRRAAIAGSATLVAARAWPSAAAVAAKPASTVTMMSTVGAGDEQLAELCREFHRLEYQYSEALLRADRWPATDPAGATAAEELGDKLCALQNEVALAIAARPSRTAASAQAKAKVVAAFFDRRPEEEDSAADRVLWSLVRDIAAGLVA